MDEKCPKCRGSMIEGRIRLDSDSVMPSQMNAYMAGFSSSPIPNVYQSSTSQPYWEEKTGKKKGFFLMNDDKSRMKIKSMRCALCGYIELFVLSEEEP